MTERHKVVEPIEKRIYNNITSHQTSVYIYYITKADKTLPKSPNRTSRRSKRELHTIIIYRFIIYDNIIYNNNM